MASFVKAPFAPDPAPTATEAALAGFCGMAAALTFASGAEAIHLTLAHLLRPGDRVILDAGSPPTYAPAIRAAQAHLHWSPPGSVEAVERRLTRLSRGPGRLFVCVPALSPLGSVITNLHDLVPLAAIYHATLIVDISQDLAAMGLTGRGLAEFQGRHGHCDILLGSLVGPFGVAAGMAAARDANRLVGLTPTGLPPVQSAALSAALHVVEGEAGRMLRRRLRGNALRLRNHLMAEGMRLLGHPSPILPIPLPPGQQARMAALLASAGPVVPLITSPLVGRHSPRWLVRLSADHCAADIDNLAEVIVDVTRASRLRP